MVSTGDDLPTRDIYGTDLVRVRGMVERGFSRALIAECLGIDKHKAAYAVVVATNDRENAPTLEEIARLCGEIQSGWDLDQFAAAARGLPRLSSTVVRDPEVWRRGREKLQAAMDRICEERVSSGELPIVFHSERQSDLKYEVRLSYRETYTRRCFATRGRRSRPPREWRNTAACRSRGSSGEPPT